MNLAGWRFLLFAVVGAAAIILLASIGVPSSEQETVDRHTGQRILIVRTMADAYHEARDAGDAVIALARARKRLAQFPGDEILGGLAAVLQTESLARNAPPPPLHPQAAAILAEQALAARTAKELRERVEERMNKQALLGLLGELEADETQAAAVEKYFAPLVRLHAGRATERMGPDERAAHASRPQDYLALARAFRARGGRLRARMRWLLRAFATSSRALEPLYQAYVEHARLPEAFLLLGLALQSRPKDPELWRRRARVATWLSLPRAEAEALRVLVDRKPSPALRRRLIVLDRYLGEPLRAIPHALALTRGSRQKKELAWPVRLALEGGDVDRALQLLTDLAKASDDPAYWREKIIFYAREDTRVERVIAEYKLLIARYPGRGYEKKLEKVYRQTNRSVALAALLHARLQAHPADRALEDELLALYMGLQDLKHAIPIVRARMERTREPRLLFADLKTYRALEIPGLEQHARSIAESGRFSPGEVEFVLDQLRALPEPVWQEIAAIVARRFIAQPAARAFLIERVDRLPDDDARADAAERLSLDHPQDLVLLRVWMERSSWAGRIESEIRARERWVRSRPGDLDNRRDLARLYSAVERFEEAVGQWRILVAKAGLGSPATLPLINALFAAGHASRAIDWLERRANLAGATVENRLDVAEQLFGREKLDRALRFYMAVLDELPDHALALLRAGQIRSWTSDPRGAIPFFRRRLAVTGNDAAQVRFYLGEALWATHEEGEARRVHLRALAELKEPTRTVQVMRAKILVRLGRVEQARPIFERVLTSDPGNVDVLLDYADAMVSSQDLRTARDLTEAARKLAPKKARTMRMDGKVALGERRYEEAAEILGETLRLHGTEAGTEAELARAYELSGETTKARDAYQRSLLLQPGNRDAEEALLRMWDKVARIVHANAEYRKTGKDRVVRGAVAGSGLLDNDRTRLGALVGFASYDAEGHERVSLGRIRISGFQRLTRLQILGAGIEINPGAPGDVPVGGWVEFLWPRSEPYRTFGARANLHTLFDDPAAAVALGGRSTGLSLFAQGDLGFRFWGSVEANYSSLSLSVPDLTDGRIRVVATAGMRLHGGEQRVGEILPLDRNELSGLVGPDLKGSPGSTRGPLVNVWVSYQAIRLLDDKQLMAVIPIGDSFDYLSVGARIDLHVAPGLGLKLEGSAGTELNQSDFFFDTEAGLSWRRSPHRELTFLVSYGQAIGRAGNENRFGLRAHFSYRW